MESLGRWFLFASSTTDTISYSNNNGITWTGLGKTIFSYFGECMAFNSDVSIILIGGNGTNSMARSIDRGITWTPIATSFKYCSDIIWSPILEKFVAVGTGERRGESTNGNTYSVAYSSDGVSWEGSDRFTNGNAIAWGNDKFIAGGYSESNSLIQSSADGIIWTDIAQNIFSSMNGIAYGNNMWVATGWGTSTIAISTDGINWTGLGKTIFTTVGGKAVYSSELNIWVAVGRGTNSIAWSTDGSIWTGIGQINNFSDGKDVHWNGHLFMAVVDGNIKHRLFYSIDGKNWTEQGSGLFNNPVSSVGFLGIHFIPNP